MPHQTVSAHLDAVLATEIGDAVGTLPVIHALRRFGRLRFHVILSCHTIELLHDKCLLLGIRHVALIDSNTNSEIILIDLFQSLCFCDVTHQGKHSRH